MFKECLGTFVNKNLEINIITCLPLEYTNWIPNETPLFCLFKKKLKKIVQAMLLPICLPPQTRDFLPK